MICETTAGIFIHERMVYKGFRFDFCRVDKHRGEGYTI